MEAVGFTGICVMTALILMGVPVSFALGTTAIVGLSLVSDLRVVLQQTVMTATQTGMDFIIICIPLFVLMGKMIYHTGIAEELFSCMQKWFGWLPGGLAMSAVMTCSAFGAVTGSSSASTATMATVIQPQLKRYSYDDSISAGAIVGAGTLAILIPPSLGFITYGVLTDTSIGALFLGGVIPGIMLTLFYCVYIFIRTLINPKLGPKGESHSLWVRFISIKDTWGLVLIFTIVIGGIYGGVFTPTEASGIGVAGVILICIGKRRLTWKAFRDAMVDTGLVTAMIYAIIVTGHLLSRFLAVTGATQAVVNWVTGLGLGLTGFVILVTIIYLILGMLLDMFGMLILTLPFLFPIAMYYQIDPILFGAYVVIMAEIGLLTPPVGVNAFVFHDMAPDIPLATVFRGVLPFAALNLAGVAIIWLYLITG